MGPLAGPFTIKRVTCVPPKLHSSLQSSDWAWPRYFKASCLDANPGTPNCMEDRGDPRPGPLPESLAKLPSIDGRFVRPWVQQERNAAKSKNSRFQFQVGSIGEEAQGCRGLEFVYSPRETHETGVGNEHRGSAQHARWRTLEYFRWNKHNWHGRGVQTSRPGVILA